jgi:hypothetical protein
MTFWVNAVAQLNPRMAASVRAVATNRNKKTPVRIVNKPEMSLESLMRATHDAFPTDTPFDNEASDDGAGYSANLQSEEQRDPRTEIMT